jgi:peptide/nickel transport system permease protein
MIRYIIQRMIAMIPTIFLIALVGFVLMELPPGDYVEIYMLQQEAQGNTAVREQEAELRQRFGLDQAVHIRFVKWLTNFARGEFGDSFVQRRPVREVIAERLPLTFAVSIAAFILSWGIGIPLGVYSATHQYSRGDNILTTVAFVGLGLPDFLLALLLLVFAWVISGEVLTGLFSAQYATAPWSFNKVLDLIKHMWIPIVAVLVTGTAWVMRVMRGNLLNVLGSNYILAARAKGIPEHVVIWKHGVRNALHPLVMALGQTLAWLVNGFTITSLVLDLPTIQTVYLRATLQQDIYMAGTILVLIGFLILVGTLLADILLAWLDPRIRFE